MEAHYFVANALLIHCGSSKACIALVMVGRAYEKLACRAMTRSIECALCGSQPPGQ